MAKVTADIVILKWQGPILSILLIERLHPPFAGAHALPGGHRNSGESPPEAAKREALEETGLVLTDLEIVGAYGEEGRDPRGDYVSICYRSVVAGDAEATAGDDAKTAIWFPVLSASRSIPVPDLPPLAFDHASMIKDALQGYSDWPTFEA